MSESMGHGSADLGFSHVAIFVADLDETVAFYRRYAGFEVTHRRSEGSGSRVAHLNDGRTDFSMVVVQLSRLRWSRRLYQLVNRFLPPLHHFGVGCDSRAEVDRLCELARGEGRLRQEPRDAGPPVGYYGMIRDPDGNDLEVAHGQEMFLALEERRGER